MSAPGKGAKPEIAGRAAVDAYVTSCPEAARPFLETARELVRRLAPDAEERVAYGLATFRLGRNLVHFGGFARHLGFYPGPEAIERFAADLAGYETSKGTVRFPLDREAPWDLVERVVSYRVEIERARLAESGR